MSDKAREVIALAPHKIMAFSGSATLGIEVQGVVGTLTADAIISALKTAGLVIVPEVPTRKMLDAAVDVDHARLGDISPLGFRCSPQQLFEECYQEMLRAVK